MDSQDRIGVGFLIKDVEKGGSKKKEDKARAIDQYLETLDILRSEYTGEREQAFEIKRVEKLILDLGGKVPENRHAAKKRSAANGAGSPSATKLPVKNPGA